MGPLGLNNHVGAQLLFYRFLAMPSRPRQKRCTSGAAAETGDARSGAISQLVTAAGRMHQVCGGTNTGDKDKRINNHISFYLYLLPQHFRRVSI